MTTLTHEEIDTLSGRDLDRAVAEKVFGVTPDPESPILTFKAFYLRAFSGNIAEAWLVVEKMQSLGWSHRIDSWTDDQERVDFYASKNGEWMERAYAIAPTAPEAICKAALQAVAQ